MFAVLPVIAPGFIVQFPAGSPLIWILPDEILHEGCVRMLTNGVGGVTGCEFITTVAEAADVHPDAFTTLKLYEPVAKPEIVTEIPDPETAPGLIVQLPEGKPLSTTLPVA